MATVALEDAFCGAIPEVECSDEVALVLNEREFEDKSITFSCLHAKRDEDGRDLGVEAWLSTELRLYYRKKLSRDDIYEWQWPRLSFPLAFP